MAGDGNFTYRDGIAVAQIVSFSVPLLYALYFRWMRQIGWFCIGVFTLLRIIGASCKLATISNDLQGLWATIFVCESLGMILIIFLLLELLERINKVINVAGKWIFWAPSLITWIDIGISIGGWVSIMDVENPLLPTKWSQASMGLLALIYAYLIGVFVLFWLRRHEYFEEERWALNAVAVCLPLLAIRVIYSLIFIGSSDMTFNAIKGNPTAYLIMTMLPEVAIICVCTYVIATRISRLEGDIRPASRKSADEEFRQGLSNR
ncbi:hypothetical protein N7532_002677 [Penicillium argentinense]|uniref:DUF7702 domain-containing protein n=1 Tax=Penicillium argentinense TaxID=1131581 RepID=A0A9W9G2F3_9EURO|nr:uncharacterized protein N7532_002677 [Penicillium argentinense]KAJ5110032.1 hypothetical protein N7532_002677 [Penicillium argentinense]